MKRTTSRLIRLIILNSILLLSILFISCATSTSNTSTSNLSTSNNTVADARAAIDAVVNRDCQLSTPGSPLRVAARCGSYTVYEDRKARSGRQIELNIAILPARSRTPQPDPVLFLAGGPGQAATESFVALAASLDAIQRERDILLIDQRGTGRNSPLRCREALSPNADDLAAEQWLRNCFESLDAEPSFYTTSMAVEDFDEVRQVLGYEKLNLIGVSYGTRVALTYLRQHPERVRTVTLDGVVPQDEVLGGDVAADAQRAIDLFFARCHADEGCQSSFPNLRDHFVEVIRRVREAPIQLTIDHPVTGEPTEVILDNRTAAFTIRLFSYAPETAALLPLLIEQAAQGNFKPLAAQSLMMGEGLADSINLGLNLSVLCAEDAPFFDSLDREEIAKSSYYGTLEIEQIERNCPIWQTQAVDRSFKAPVESDLPVLILSGETDPVTPPSNGDEVAKHLSNSLHIVAPGQGHNVIFRGCLPRIFADFVEQGGVDGLNTECVNQLTPLPFFISPSGSTP